MARINPFKPNAPISPGMFVGRINEIMTIEKCLLQTRSGTSASFLITGERGIGKSSLLNYVKWVAEGHIPVEKENLRFLVVDTDIDTSTTQLGLIQKIELGLRRTLAKTEPARDALSKIWDFMKGIRGIGPLSFGSNASSQLDETVMEEFAYSLASTVERVCAPESERSVFSARFDGFLIMVDEADNSSGALNLGSLLKLLMERLERRGCTRVMLALAGLPDVRDVLIASHPSSLRLFTETCLGRLAEDEMSRVIDICLERANEDNAEKTRIEDEARSILLLLSEGYPHFIQQFGYSAFDADSDGVISLDDVRKGAFGKGGALELIGDRYYRNDFYNRIRKENYRQVLRIMADNLDGWVTRSEIRAKFKGEESTLNNAIKTLRDRHIILSKEGQRGIYRLQHKGFALWIKFYTSDPAEVERTLGSSSADAPSGQA